VADLFGLSSSTWSEITTLVAGGGVVVALAVGIVSARASFASAKAAARAAAGAEATALAAQAHADLVRRQIEITYPVFEASVDPAVLHRIPQDGTVMVVPVAGSMLANDVDAWICWHGEWMKGSWPSISPNLAMSITQRVGIPVSRASVDQAATPFADFPFREGMVGVVWDRPDGRWRFGRELQAIGAPPSPNHVKGPVPSAY
jgi:hypothetical protein